MSPIPPWPLTDNALDRALSAQLLVAWAGEQGRLGWWQSQATVPLVGLTMLEALLPATFRWASLEAAREAARQADAKARHQDGAPDGMVSLFHFGAKEDERLRERLAKLKHQGAPVEALPGLAPWLERPEGAPGLREALDAWLAQYGEAKAEAAPAGRLVVAAPPGGLGAELRALLANLRPLGERYPLPHLRRQR